MSCGVCSQVLLYQTQVGNLFQIAVHLLVAGNRQQYSFLFAGRIICIFSQDFQRNIQQRNITHVLCFLTWLPDPQVSVVVFYDMLRGKLLHVDESQTGKARKKHQSKGDRNKENQTQLVVKQRFCSRLPLQPNSRERQDNARFPLPSHYLFRNLPEV